MGWLYYFLLPSSFGVLIALISLVMDNSQCSKSDVLSNAKVHSNWSNTSQLLKGKCCFKWMKVLTLFSAPQCVWRVHGHDPHTHTHTCLQENTGWNLAKNLASVRVKIISILVFINFLCFLNRVYTNIRSRERESLSPQINHTTDDK